MKTLVMIPAFGCDARLYAPQIKALGPSIKIQTIIGRGASFEEMIEEVLQQAPESFAILGTSMGGRLALEVALAAPERVEAFASSDQVRAPWRIRLQDCGGPRAFAAASVTR